MDAGGLTKFCVSREAARADSLGGFVFSAEEIKRKDFSRLGPTLARNHGIGTLSLCFDYGDDSPLVANLEFRNFSQAVIRCIPSPFFSLSLQNETLKAMFVCTLENLEIRWQQGDAQVTVLADPKEFSSRFHEEADRLHFVLSANDALASYPSRLQAIQNLLLEPRR